MSVQLDHVAVGLRSLADAPSFAVGVLGGTPLGAGPGNGFRWAQWSYEGGGVLEFLEPAGPPGGFLHRFLDARGPGVHHVTFKVPDLASYAARAGRLGFEVVGYDDRFTGWKECFLHPRSAQGTVVQMAEVHPEADEFAGLPFEWPASPPRAEPPARVLGLRLAARNAPATRKLFVELLGGECEERPGGLHLRWPDSPLEIAVRLEPAAATEGPRAVEVACARRLALPEGPYPLLGAAFVQVEGAP